MPRFFIGSHQVSNGTASILGADAAHLSRALRVQRGELVVVVEGAVLPLVRTYSDVGEGEACAVLGSSGRLEVSVNLGSAARQLGAARGAPVRVRKASRAGG